MPCELRWLLLAGLLDGLSAIRHTNSTHSGTRSAVPGVAEKSATEDAARVKAYLEQLLVRPSDQLAFAHVYPLPVGVQAVLCKHGSCVMAGSPADEVARRINVFKETALRQSRVTDKVTTHSYEIMYGTYLMPAMQKKNTKMLEIGLGCNMNYGAGASVSVWKALFPAANLWEAEYNAACVQQSKANGKLNGVNVVTGDQGDVSTVRRWVSESGGKFDAVIDDGGHKNNQIRTSFEVLWPNVNPGGIYAIEDLQVGRWNKYRDPADDVMADIIQDWALQLLDEKIQPKFPLPANIESIFCQREACMLFKRA